MVVIVPALVLSSVAVAAPPAFPVAPPPPAPPVAETAAISGFAVGVWVMVLVALPPAPAALVALSPP
ncbi:MAG TPA: hypothetical protein VFE12_19620, partial [Acetobacteraceae bacterium]|nr:hypothetical protein [Acetobacteraceae bacterium]